MHSQIPDCVARLFWEVDLDYIDLARHRDYVMERVMSRGTWEAMGWLRETYARGEIAGFIQRKGGRLSPRDEAYWALISGVERTHRPGGGRPSWA